MTDAEISFHRGFLYALAERRRSFRSAGVQFQEAYGAALRAAGAFPFAQEALRYYDAVFGTYHHAEAMVLHGMASFIVELDGARFTVCAFKLKAGTATKELMEMLSGRDDEIEMYRRMADTFYKKLDEVQ